MKLKLGVIGTGWISRSFIDAALSTKKYTFDAIYTRRIESGVSFTEDFDSNKIEIFDNLAEFVASPLDVIYIASPNALHFEQTKTAILAGKNVIVEKPAFSNPTELDEIIKLAAQEKVLFFEAARNLHEKSFEIVRNFLADKTIIGADFTYAKYSSKMPALLNGELPNKFNAAFSGGLLADLGVYLLYAAHAFFGKPKYARYDAEILPSGVDVSGVGVLAYEDFKVAIKTGGNYNSYLPNEIYTTTGTLVLDAVNAISYARFIALDGTTTELPIVAVKNNMQEEAKDFANVLEAPNDYKQFEKYEEWLSIAINVAETSYAMRESAGIQFDADKK
ncbi:Gfo/Idh/MocA family protein [Lactococcus insecticola]|uniref:Oxidoreductase n=1 Tax=Pseudolactococcus insecticola TaxID=2709158 RepID=A0A6A0B3Q5_9LACT|nr:Gfo/Idh/MocA family oxidoreductase [Lactococcus insecticola]GFH39782.1 oxidoreductase [Lactococcus insecticola]